MTNTYTPIASVTLSATASEVVFSGLPQTFRDLIVVTNARAATATSYFRMRFNGDTGSNYFHVQMLGFEGGGVQSASGTINSLDLDYVGNALTSQDNVHNLQIMDYSATDKHKTCLLRQKMHSSAGDLRVGATAIRWGSTSAINSISIFLNSGNIASGSTFTIYGVIA